MNFLKTLAKFSIGTWVQAALGLATTPLIAWFIVPEEFGKSSMFILATNFLLNIVMLALDQGFARHYNDSDNKSALLRAVLIPVISMSVICISGIEIFKHWISSFLYSSPDTSSVHLLSASLITSIVLRIATMTIRMQGSATKFSVIQIVQAISNFIVTILYAKFVNQSFQAILAGLIVSQLLGSLLGIFYNYKIWSGIFNVRIDFVTFIKPILTYSLPFVPTFLLAWVFQGVDKTFLRAFSDFSQLGIYATATKIAFSLNVIQTGFTTFWFPFSLERYRNSPDDKTIYSTVFNALSFTFGALILLIILFQKLVLFILPTAYHNVISIFPLLLLIPMLYTLSEVTVVGVTYKKKTFQHLYVSAFSCIVNMLAAYLLIPRYGAMGASIAMIAGYFTFFIFRTYYGNKSYSITIDTRKFFVTISLVLGAAVLTIISSTYFYLTCIGGIVTMVFMYKSDLRRITTF